MNNSFSKYAIWVVVLLVLFMVFKHFDRTISSNVTSVPYSEFLDDIRSKQIKEATVDEIGRTITATTTEGKKVKTQMAVYDRGIWSDLVNNGVKFDIKQPEEQSFLLQALFNWFPMLLLIGVWVFFMRQMQGG